MKRRKNLRSNAFKEYVDRILKTGTTLYNPFENEIKEIKNLINVLEGKKRKNKLLEENELYQMELERARELLSLFVNQRNEILKIKEEMNWDLMGKI